MTMDYVRDDHNAARSTCMYKLHSYIYMQARQTVNDVLKYLLPKGVP